ncbi:MAG: hypothetical protein AB8B71_02745 [Paracoccaceae bacterium]
MTRPNTKFELSVDDLEIIETALRSRKISLAERLVETKLKDDEAKDSLSVIHDLLGRLHNQKEFYRPKTGAYVGG